MVSELFDLDWELFLAQAAAKEAAENAKKLEAMVVEKQTTRIAAEEAVRLDAIAPVVEQTSIDADKVVKRGWTPKGAVAQLSVQQLDRSVSAKDQFDRAAA